MFVPWDTKNLLFYLLFFCVIKKKTLVIHEEIEIERARDGESVNIAH